FASRGGQRQGVVAGHGGRVVRFVVAQRAYAGEAVEDVGAGKLVAGMAVDHVQQVIGFFIADRHLGRVAGVFAVGGADQGEPAEIGQGEDDAPVLVLQNVGLVAVV